MPKTIAITSATGGQGGSVIRGITRNVYVAALIARPEVSLPGRYACVKTETTSFRQIMATWSKVTGKEAAYVEIPAEEYIKLWGPFGQEMDSQYKFGEEFGDWGTFREDLLTEEELGIERGQLVGLERYLESVKATLL
ncbi:hypothetical protein MMC13_006086 [Lambiella insularis]|nr:hypothetical protein [Lambiella insularis]